MGRKSETMKVAVLALCAIALAAAVEDTAVESLGDEGEPTLTNGGDTTHVAHANGGEGHGYWITTTTSRDPSTGSLGTRRATSGRQMWTRAPLWCSITVFTRRSSALRPWRRRSSCRSPPFACTSITL